MDWRFPRSAKTDLAAAYENYGEKEDTQGMRPEKEEPHTMSDGHGLTMLAGAGTTYDRIRRSESWFR